MKRVPPLIALLSIAASAGPVRDASFQSAAIVWTAVARDTPTADVSAVNRVIDDYNSAWLASDAEAVMHQLTPDSVLVPAEKTPFAGSAAIREYWWPAGGPSFRLQRFTTTRDQIIACGDLATVRGTQIIEWQSGAERWRTHGNYVTVLRKSGGRWRIAIQMAGNSPNERIQ